MEVKEFQSLLNRVSEAFTYALTVNADAEERIRQEFAKKFAAQQQDLAAEKTRSDLAAKAAETADDGLFPALTLAERLELLTQRCLVSSTTAHDDLFPYDDCWREAADKGRLHSWWPRWLPALRGSGKRETKA